MTLTQYSNNLRWMEYTWVYSIFNACSIPLKKRDEKWEIHKNTSKFQVSIPSCVDKMQESQSMISIHHTFLAIKRMHHEHIYWGVRIHQNSKLVFCHLCIECRNYIILHFVNTKYDSIHHTFLAMSRIHNDLFIGVLIVFWWMQLWLTLILLIELKAKKHEYSLWSLSTMLDLKQNETLSSFVFCFSKQYNKKSKKEWWQRITNSSKTWY